MLTKDIYWFNILTARCQTKKGGEMMKIRNLLANFCFALIIFFAPLASAQVLVSGETGGQGNKAILLSANGIFPEGLELVNFYAQYIYGMNDRLDIGPIYGNITVLGQTQHYVGLGWNLNLVRRNRAFVDVSFFGAVTAPFNNRNKASIFLTASALVISRPINIGNRFLSLYTGISTLVPLGEKEDKLFTPPGVVWSIPIGFSTSLVDGWSVYTEVDVHPKFKAVGVGLIRAF